LRDPTVAANLTSSRLGDGSVLVSSRDFVTVSILGNGHRGSKRLILYLGMVSIPDKINALLAERGLLKRDLARALQVSPQTATDICKGRSAVTVPHLRKLVAFFGLRADFWLDEERERPTEADELIPQLSAKIHALAPTGLLHAEDPAGFVRRLLQLANEQRSLYVERFGQPPPEERRLLGLPLPGQGHVGRIGGFEDDESAAAGG
jgi:plasmid maintenance system antidote protein VapI